MSWSDALRGTQRQALIFAVAFVLLGLLLDMLGGRASDIGQRAVSVLVATGVYWVVLAWMRRRAAGR